MKNGILTEINSFLTTKTKEDNMISLYEIIEFLNDLKIEFENINQKLIKRINRKLSKNLSFFNYEVKKINLDTNLVLTINHELQVKKILISKNGEILNDIKNKDTFSKILALEIQELTESFNEFLNLIDINIKTKVNDLNIEITNDFIGIFMFKSKNWITMGKAFYLKYNFFSNEFVYEIDSINLKKFLNQKETEIFNNIFIKKNTLPNDFQLKYEEYFNKKLEDKKNFITNLKNRIRNVMKKK